MGLFSFFSNTTNPDSAATGTEFSATRDDQPTAASARGKRVKPNAAIDPNLAQKKRARRRLIGAIALVLAAVIGLPMLLDSEPKPLANDVEIQIPSKEKPFTPAPAAVAEPAQRTGNAPSKPVEATAPEQSEPVAPASAAADAEPESIPKQTATNKPEHQPNKAVEAPAKLKSPPGESVIRNPDNQDAQRARTILEGGAATKPDSVSNNGKFIVQVAALASKEKVDELQRKLSAAGIHSYTQKVATEAGERIRIRIGPLPTKVEAEAMRGHVLKLGLNGTLVPLNP